VIRLQHPPAESALAALNEDFEDIVEGAKIRAIAATRDEKADEDSAELPRIAFGFDRRSYGRLRQMIDVLNGL
jgi:hypothetical protein